jgi:hypothetical protein
MLTFYAASLSRAHYVHHYAPRRNLGRFFTGNPPHRVLI